MHSDPLPPRRFPPRRPPWASRDFTLLTAAMVTTSLCGAGSTIAAAFAVLRDGGGASAVGGVAAARTAALVVFLLVGGAVADRLPRHRIMVAANTLNCASQALFAVLVLTGHPPFWQMAVLSALGGTGQAFFNPAAEGMMMSSVAPGHSGRAFAVFRIGVNAATIGGTALSGALITVLGPGWVLALDAIGFGVAAGLRSFLRPAAAARAAREDGGVLRGLRDGWREFATRRWLWAVVAQFSVVNGVFAAAESVYGPLIARQRLGGASPWGLALALFGVGSVLGGMAMTRWRPRRPLFAGTLGVFPMALPLAALAAVPTLPALGAAMLVSGAALEVFGVSWMVALSQEVPSGSLSRVSAYDWLGQVSLLPVAAAVSGPVAGAIGMPAALWTGAALIVVLTAAVLGVPEIRSLTRHDPPAPEPAATGPAAATPA